MDGHPIPPRPITENISTNTYGHAKKNKLGASFARAKLVALSGRNPAGALVVR